LYRICGGESIFWILASFVTDRGREEAEEEEEKGDEIFGGGGGGGRRGAGTGGAARSGIVLDRQIDR